MANVLGTDKQISIIAALAEGSSIRAIERMTGVLRDTIMRLGVRVGQQCTAMMDARLRDLPCTRLEVESLHVRGVPVTEKFQGKTVWDGVVEVFELVEHETTTKVYAWTHETDDSANPTCHVTVLHLGPVNSPETAVRAAIIQEYRNAEAAEA